MCIRDSAVTEHLNELQGYFFKEKKGAKKEPYTLRLTQEQVDEILDRAMRLSDRYRIIDVYKRQVYTRQNIPG